MKIKFLLANLFSLLFLFLFVLPTGASADTRLEPISYEPIACGSNCTTLRIYYNQAPPIGGGWGIANFTPCCASWSGSSGPTNIHDTYADYTWYYPSNQGTILVVLQNGDTVSSPFPLDFSITEPTTFSPFDSVEETGYEFIPCGSDCGTVRIYYNKVPPSEGWGLVNWENYMLWSGASGPTNIHNNYADYTFYTPYVPTGLTHFSLVTSDDFSSPFTVDWSGNGSNKAPIIQPLSDATITEGDIYSANGSFADADSLSWTATVDYGEGAGPETLSLNPDKTFTLSHQYTTTGDYTVTVHITDTQSGTGSASATVHVENPAPVSLSSVADSYIKQGSQNQNEGSSTFMRIQSSGHNRALIKFDQQQIAAAVGNSQNYTATLKFIITDNGNNWGTEGRTIDLHRLTTDWMEGNGFIVGNQPSDRGTGSGVTWNCTIDTDIHNQNDDCSGTTAWDMTHDTSWPFISTPTATANITNNETGVVSFDVTGDIQAFLSGTANDGWIIKKTNEGQNGLIEFGSKESTSAPQLVITRN